jgi:putative ABC transport system ATP-binding protein
MAATTATCKNPGEDEAVVQVRNLSHFFGEGDFRKQILFDNCFDIKHGEIVIMTGPSGSGKTTFLTLLGALRTVQEGSLKVMGQELRGLSARELVEIRKQIGFIFQGHNLLGALSAYENVRAALQLTCPDHREISERVSSMLARLGLESRMHHRPSGLSGGQKQRVAIGRALVHRPRLILADEPTAALDRETGHHVVDILRDFARDEGACIIIVTHDNRILDVADRIVNMVDGRIMSDVLVGESLKICEFLAKIEAFQRLTPNTLSDIADRMTRETHPEGRIIIRQGEEPDKFYLVRRGSVDVLVHDRLHTIQVATLKEGDFFGEMALLTGETRNATVIAKEDVTLYVLNKDDFESALGKSATFEEELRKVLFQRQ